MATARIWKKSPIMARLENNYWKQSLLNWLATWFSLIMATDEGCTLYSDYHCSTRDRFYRIYIYNTYTQPRYWTGHCGQWHQHFVNNNIQQPLGKAYKIKFIRIMNSVGRRGCMRMNSVVPGWLTTARSTSTTAEPESEPPPYSVQFVANCFFYSILNYYLLSLRSCFFWNKSQLCVTNKRKVCI